MTAMEFQQWKQNFIRDYLVERGEYITDEELSKEIETWFR